MNTIITGSCTAHNYDDMLDAIAAAELIGITPTRVLTGMAVGGDEQGARWAEENDVLVTQYVQDWPKHGDNAIIERDRAMVKVADALIVLWHHNDIRHLGRIIEMADAKGIPVAVWEVGT